MPKLGALAVVKAHPLVFGAVLAVAIGIVVYQLVKPKKQKKHKYSNSSGRPDDRDDDDATNTGNIFYYDPETKSVTNAAPLSNASNNDLRKRHIGKKSPSSADKSSSEVSHEKKVSVSKEVQTESIDDNKNIDDNKVLPDKNIDSAMNLNDKVSKYLKNISESDSTDSNDESNCTSDIFNPVKKCCDCESCCGDDSISSPSDSFCSSWSDISLTDVNDMKKIKASKARSISSVISANSGSSLGTVLSGDSQLCRGCEQNPVNTHTQPCNHRYMCSDCAMRIFRLFKKCKVCRAKIESIVVEE